MVTEPRHAKAIRKPAKLVRMLHAANLKMVSRTGLTRVCMVEMKAQHDAPATSGVDLVQELLRIQGFSEVQSEIVGPDSHAYVVFTSRRTVTGFVDLASDVQ